MAVKKFQNFRGGLNLQQSTTIEDNEFKIAKNVFYNRAGQIQTRRGYTTFGDQIGSDPITSYFFFQTDDTRERIAICNSGTACYEFDGTNWNSIKTGLIEYETTPGRTSNRTRRDHVVYKNVIYTCDGVNPYASYDGTTYTQIGLSAAVTCTFDNTTNYVEKTTHGLNAGDEVFFYGDSGTLPAEITENQVYYVLAVDADNFQITTSKGGTALAFTDDGTGTLKYKKLSEPRVRYLHFFNDTIFGAGDDGNASTLRYSNTTPADGTSINDNFQVIGGDEAGIINGLHDYGQLVTVFKNERSYSFDLASETQAPLDIQTGGYANRTIENVANDLVYFNERGIDSLIKRSGVTGSGGIESKPLSENVRELVKLIEEKQYNSGTAMYIKKLDNYYFAFDTNNDNRPDTTLVWNSRTGGWTQYTLPALYDFGYYINSTNEYQFLFASASGGQMYEFEYGFDDNGVAIDVELETKDFDFDDPAQEKMFGYVDVTGYKQQSGDITIKVKVDGDTGSEGIVSDTQIDVTADGVILGLNALGVEPLGSEDNNDDELTLYPFTVRLPLYQRGKNLAVNLSSTGVQWIMEKIRIEVNAETFDVFDFNSII